jgi:hypothetical protein
VVSAGSVSMLSGTLTSGSILQAGVADTWPQAAVHHRSPQSAAAAASGSQL